MKEIEEVISIITKVDNPKFTKAFLKELLTKHEVDEISKRWKIVKLLNQKLPQREIAKKLKTSLCNITRGSKELKKKNSAFVKALKILEG